MQNIQFSISGIRYYIVKLNVNIMDITYTIPLFFNKNSELKSRFVFKSL